MPQPDDDQDHQRLKFARAMRATPVDQLTAILRTSCLAGAGHWQDPAPGGDHGRPATHLFEISFLGQSANGTTPEEAARNWRKAALTQIEATP